MPAIQFSVNENTRRQLKSQAAAAGLNLGDYVSHLVDQEATRGGRDRQDGLSASQWREFEKLKFDKTPELRAEFSNDFEAYWSYLQNEHRARYSK